MQQTLRLAMWSGPRNISTAMMRAWGNRPDTFVCDEPLYAHYLRETGIPVRVVWGAQDAYLPLQTVGKPLADALGVHLQVIEGGHFLPLDNPQGVAAAVLEHCG